MDKTAMGMDYLAKRLEVICNDGHGCAIGWA